jgi:uncharacterized delta-60 repeat protein
MKRLVLLSILVTACGDNIGGTPDAAPPDTSTPDVAIDGRAAFVKPTPFKVALSASGHDVLQSVKPGPDGSFYAAGFASPDTLAANRVVIVAKLLATGGLDPGFGSGGVFTSTLGFVGGNGEIGVGVQSTGHIVVSATIADEVNPLDRDVGVFRVDATGTLDTNFGTAGYARVELNTGLGTTTITAADAARGLAIGPSDHIYLLAVSRGPAAATDTDFTVATLLATTGALDTAGYGGGDGFFQYDIGSSDATARALYVGADGKVLAGGYADTSFTPGTTVQPVLFKLAADGAALDPAFTPFHEVVLTAQTEVYNVAVHGNTVTTAGYGREVATDLNDWVALRFDLTTGERDEYFGGAPQGAVTLDPSGTMIADNCRNAIALPDGSTALVGSTGGSGAVRSAAFAILTPSGSVDSYYGPNTFTLGTDGDDQFWGGAVSSGKLMLVGFSATVGTPSATNNDDAHGVVFGLD